MPICEADPWRLQYFAHVETAANIPTEDSDAWQWYPRHRWIYDKLAVALSQKLEAGPHGTPPPRFPVFSKPIVNLKGMGAGSRVLHSQADYEEHYAPGHFWMPLLDGRHRLDRYRGGRWRAALVAARHRRGRPAVARSIIGRCRRRPSRVIEAHCGAWVRAHLRRLYRHAQPRDHRRQHHRGASALRRPMAGSLRGRLGRGSGAALRDRASGISPMTTAVTATASCCLDRHGVRYRHPPPALLEEVKRNARYFQRADHVPRRSCAGASCDAAGRLPACHCQRFRSRRRRSPRANGSRSTF